HRTRAGRGVGGPPRRELSARGPGHRPRDRPRGSRAHLRAVPSARRAPQQASSRHRARARPGARHDPHPRRFDRTEIRARGRQPIPGLAAGGGRVTGAAARARSGTLLLVEDDIDIRIDLAEILREEGYHVVTAGNGAEALSELRAGLRPCLIILDLMMPGMNGWEFRDEQRRDPELAGVPVVVLSSISDIAHHATALGAAGYLDKPVKLPALFEALARHC